jgi:hypothetical protein
MVDRSNQRQILTALRATLDPDFKVDFKEDFWFTRLLQFCGHSASIILGHTLYVPRTLLANLTDAQENDLWEQLYAHEGMHIAQRQDMGWLTFHRRYMNPQLTAGVVWLVCVVALAVAWVLDLMGNLELFFALVASILACGAVAVNPYLARWRARIEIEAYATIFYITPFDKQAALFGPMVDLVWCCLNSSTYLWCGKSITRSFLSARLQAHNLGATTVTPVMGSVAAWRKNLRAITNKKT